MFEKEAEEYADKDFGMYEPTDHERYAKETDWRNGAEFGYNKAMEEMVQNGLALQSDMDKTIEQNIALKKELEKANEWHYVKDGDLPPLNTNVLVIHRWARTPEVGKRIEVFINSSVWVWAMRSNRYRHTSDDENVIAWKEIVLPKESEQMSFSDLLKEKGIDTNNRDMVDLLQSFYQEGYVQGVHDKNPNYEYSLKYKEVVERVLSLFTRTQNPIGLENLGKALDAMDEYDKYHLSLF